MVMLTSPPFSEPVLPTENVLIFSFSAFPSSGGLICFAFSVMSPPFPELPDPE